MNASLRHKLAVSYCLHDDIDFLAASIESFAGSGADLVGFVSRVPWHGESGDWSGAVAIIEAAGGTVVEGEWRSEDEHRRAALAWLIEHGYTHSLIPDGDEIIEPSLLQALVRLSKNDLADAVHVEWDTYWKSPEYVIRPRERFTPLILVRLDAVEHASLRNYHAPRTLFLLANYGIIHHLSYVGDDERIARKISTWSHRGELVPGWWEGVWLAWDEDRLLGNLHPTHPGAYQHAARIPVPEPLKTPHLESFAEARRTPKPTPPIPWPTISLVIPTCGRSPIFKECLAALEASKDLLHEVIVVQDGPCKGLKVPKGAPFQTVRCKEHRGFAAACNEGIARAKGEILVFLNDDAVLPRAGLIELVRPLLGKGTLAATGAMSNRCGHFQQTPASCGSLQQIEGFAEDFASRRVQDFETDMLVGLCLAVKRQALSEVGPFDERFGVGTFEDNDLCYRLRRAGYRLLVAARSFVYHEGSSTLSQMGGNVPSLLSRNEQIFRSKWALDLETGFASHLSGLSGSRIEFNEGRRPEELLGRTRVRAAKADISLCMIVRDEERVLGACLASAAPFFAETIVVDTGSKDRTVEIAKEHGATVYEFPWTDSFSEARNESLRYANGKWIFWMDADDTLPWASGEVLLEEALTAQAGVVGFVVPVQFVEDGPAAGTRVDHVKLFRRFDGARFQFRIHEQILPCLRARGGAIARCSAHVMHSGYDTSPEGQAKKHARDWKLLRLDYAEQGDHPFVLFNIGMTHHFGGKHAKAARWLRRCIRRCGENDSILRKAYVLWGGSLTFLGKEDLGIAAFTEGLEAVGPDPELHFRLGQSLATAGRTEEAKEQMRQALMADVEDHYTSLDVGIQGFKARRHLGSLCLETGDYNGAREHLLAGLELAPGDLGSAKLLFDAAIDRADFVTSNQMTGLVGTATRGGEMWAEMLARHAGAVGGDGNDLEALRSILHRDPGAMGARMVLARKLVAGERFDEAAPHLEVLAKTGSAEGAFMLGVHHLQLGQVEAAKACFERSLELNPGHQQTEEYLRGLQDEESEDSGTDTGQPVV